MDRTWHPPPHGRLQTCNECAANGSTDACRRPVLTSIPRGDAPRTASRSLSGSALWWARAVMALPVSPNGVHAEQSMHVVIPISRSPQLPAHQAAARTTFPKIVLTHTKPSLNLSNTRVHPTNANKLRYSPLRRTHARRVAPQPRVRRHRGRGVRTGGLWPAMRHFYSNLTTRKNIWPCRNSARAPS